MKKGQVSFLFHDPAMFHFLSLSGFLFRRTPLLFTEDGPGLWLGPVLPRRPLLSVAGAGDRDKRSRPLRRAGAALFHVTAVRPPSPWIRWQGELSPTPRVMWD